jgi:hypothetical protein
MQPPLRTIARGCTRQPLPGFLSPSAQRHRLAKRVWRSSGAPAHDTGRIFLGCALTAYVGEVDETAAEMAPVLRAKQSLADRLIARDVDVSYREVDGTTLLMHVVTSYTPDAWKLRAVERLLAAGADPNARNVDGASALELAHTRAPENL